MREPLKPGFSLFHWAKKITTETNLSGRGDDPLRLFTREEMAENNTEDKCYVILKGKVYNVTPYIDYHPGGRDFLLSNAGTDVTAAFMKYHSWVNHEDLIGELELGWVEQTAEEKAAEEAAIAAALKKATGDHGEGEGEGEEEEGANK